VVRRGWFPLVRYIHRFPLPDRHLIGERVRQFRGVRGIHCRYRHTAQSIALPGQPPPHHTVSQILHPLPRPVDRPPRVHNHRFVARYVDYLRHTDVHEMQMLNERIGGDSTISLIAFLDKSSRFIMHYRLIADNRSEACAAVPDDAFQVWTPP
jgi:hypothetical protein